MDYKEKYEQIIAKLKDFYQYDVDSETAKRLEVLFPELRESEDERIRKEILEYISKATGYKEWIAWLEKQGEQKPIIEMKSAEESLGIDSETYSKIVDECIYGEQKPAWSEEDEKILGKCIDAASGYYSPEDKQSMKDWLKSLKYIVQPHWKPTNEQIEALGNAIEFLKDNDYSVHELIILFNDLQFIRI